MSQMDDFDDDDWDDCTPSFQDKLIEYVENNAFDYDNADSDNESDHSMDYTSTKAAFNLFLDELFEIPVAVKKSNSAKKPLAEISVNQQHNRSLLNKKQNTKHEEESRIMDSQDDSFWSELDTDLLSKLESNANNKENQTADTDSPVPSPIPPFSGFSTASGKTIAPPSKERLEKERQKMMNENIHVNEEVVTPLFGVFTTGRGKTFKMPSKEAIEREKQKFLENDQPPTVDESSSKQPVDEVSSKPVEEEAPVTELVGVFTTGRGKQIKTSEESKRNVLKLFQEDDAESKKEKDQKAAPMMSGFSFASGKPVVISEKAKQKTLAMLNDDNPTTKIHSFPSFASTNQTNPPLSNKRPSDEPLSTDSKYETVMNQYGGLQMGQNRKGITTFLNTKRQAIEADSTVAPQPLRTIENVRLNQPFNSPVKLPTKDPPTKTSTTPRNIRAPAVQKQNKPFKSPIVNKDKTKAAVNNNKPTSKPRLTPVFDLTIPKNRYPLSALGKPLQFSKDQLLSRNIPASIINMSINTAKRYLFDGSWGHKNARIQLIEAGALHTRATPEWVENHYGLIVWKFACLIRSYPAEFANYWNSTKVLDQLLYRYEREVNRGHQSVLKKVLEGDHGPSMSMVLVISEIVKINKPLHFNTSSKYHLVLSDGWYQVGACIDFRMERAVDKKKLKVGHKLTICGAQLVGNKNNQSPLNISNNSTMLSISTNACLPAKWDTKLGYHKSKIIMRSLPTIFDDGGLVTALDIIVCRKLPLLYNETLPGGMTITRTVKEEEEARHAPDHLQRQSSAFALPNFKADHHHHQPQLERTKSEPKKQEDRRVSGFFKIRFCDAKSKADQPLSTLLISNVNELNYMDIVEGNRYKVYSIVPYRPYNKRHLGLDLKTTRVTNWEPILSTKVENAYIPRHITACKDIHLNDTVLEFDLAVFVLEVGTATLDISNGRKLYHQKLFVSDSSGKICQIDFRVPINPFLDVKGQVLGLQNVRFELHDNKFGITCLKATDETETISKLTSVAEYMQKGVKSLRSWVAANPQRVQELTQHLQRIVQ